MSSLLPFFSSFQDILSRPDLFSDLAAGKQDSTLPPRSWKSRLHQMSKTTVFSENATNSSNMLAGSDAVETGFSGSAGTSFCLPESPSEETVTEENDRAHKPTIGNDLSTDDSLSSSDNPVTCREMDDRANTDFDMAEFNEITDEKKRKELQALLNEDFLFCEPIQGGLFHSLSDIKKVMCRNVYLVHWYRRR